jgi:hypothetical protein
MTIGNIEIPNLGREFGFSPFAANPGGNPPAGTAGGSSSAGGTAIFNTSFNTFFNAQGAIPIYFAYLNFTHAQIQNPNPPGGQVYLFAGCPSAPANVALWPLMMWGKANQDAGGYAVASNLQLRYNGIAQDIITFAMIGAGANTRYAFAATSQSTAWSGAGRTIRGRNLELSFATANLGGGAAGNSAQVWLAYALMIDP